MPLRKWEAVGQGEGKNTLVWEDPSAVWRVWKVLEPMSNRFSTEAAKHSHNVIMWHKYTSACFPSCPVAALGILKLGVGTCTPGSFLMSCIMGH